MAARPSDADMNGMRCYYRSVPTDNSVAPRRAVREISGKAKGRNSREESRAGARINHTMSEECYGSRMLPLFDSLAFFCDSSSAPISAESQPREINNDLINGSLLNFQTLYSADSNISIYVPHCLIRDVYVCAIFSTIVHGVNVFYGHTATA